VRVVAATTSLGEPPGGGRERRWPLSWLVATVPLTVAAITVVPAWLGTRRPEGEVLQSELA
jgi:hypothetical protein